MKNITNSLGQPAISLNTNILDIEIPKELEKNIPTGWACIDVLFAGDGITPSTSCIFTGIPGSGKSTTSLQLADHITKSGNIALYNCGEESLYQVRKTCRRLGLKHGFTPLYEATVQGIIKKAKQVQKANPKKQVFLFVDSLQTVSWERPKGQRGRAPNKAAVEVMVVESLTQWAKETFGIVFIIGHVTKNGEFAGKQEIIHAVDSHLHLEIEKDRKSEVYGQRVAGMDKNRFGASQICFTYECTATGIVFEQETIDNAINNQ